MTLSLYNTFANSEQEFVPLKKGEVTMYTCGPTVYSRPHIGNYATFLFADLLRRWLEAGHNYHVTHVKNITDVGHLVADADEGEDKIEKQAREEQRAKSKDTEPLTKEKVLQLAEKYTQLYLQDEVDLNFLQPHHRPKASETIPEMITMIETLIKKGHAYETDDGIYFAVETFPDYGKLSGNTLENLEAGSRIKIDAQKKHPADFALWKKCVGENEHHILRWESPWGEGFPGWHIECSCMSRKLLGDQIDIHTGGEDLIFPHHECEIAQSEGSGPSPCVRYWVHRRFIDIGEVKMSKSIGNVLNLPDILEMGYSSADLRYYLLSVHYRTNLKFTKKGLDDAHKARRRISEWMDEVESATTAPRAHSSGVDLSINAFKESMNADLNTPAALAEIFAAMNFYYKYPEVTEETLVEYLEFITLIKSTFGCFEPEENTVPAEVLELAKQREKARLDKDFGSSDTLRDAIKELGYEVKDTEDGQKIIKL